MNTIKTTITLLGREYPVVFNMDTLLNFEDIMNRSFFDCRLTTMRERIAMVMAAVFTADEDTTLTVDELKDGGIDNVRQINEAFAKVMELSKPFFHIPDTLTDDAPEKPADQGDDEEPKN